MAVTVAIVVTAFSLTHTGPSQGASAASTQTSSTQTSSTLPSNATTPVKFSSYYLAIGASSSTGIEPTGIPQHRSRHTQDGYTNDLVTLEGYRGVALTLTEIGCPGETVQTILNTKLKDHCYQLPQTQLTKALSFFSAHQGGPGLVSIDLGFNNVRTCLTPTNIDLACVASGIAAVRVDMPRLLKVLKDAAGPHVKFVGLEYYDPFLSHFFDGANGPAVATETLVAMNQLNAVLNQAYSAAGVAVADVPTYFQMNVTTRETLDNVGVIPVNVQQACNLTWMCQPAPFGPDDHPNDEGYLQIANAMVPVIPPSW
ncbi:MAG TPA: SGNH/GDSL hydrolase family protein [Acidimicrobiales bacterium]